MKDDTSVIALRQPDSVEDPLTEIALEGARRMLAAALQAEAEAFVEQFCEELLPDGRQRVVRHRYGPERVVQTGIGAGGVAISLRAGTCTSGWTEFTSRPGWNRRPSASSS